jgi:hypothetical protein
VQSADAEEEAHLFVRCNDTQVEDSDPKSVSDQHGVTGAIFLTDALGSSSNRRGSIVVEDYESDVSEPVPTHLHTAAKITTTEFRAIFNHGQLDPPARPDIPIPEIGDIVVEDPSLRRTAHQDAEIAFAIKRSAELDSGVSDQVRAKSVGKLANKGNQTPRLGLIKKKSGFMTEVRGILTRRRSKPDSVQRMNLKQDEGIQVKTSDLVKASDAIKDAITQTLTSVESEVWTTEHHVHNQCDQSTQTSTPIPVLAVDEGTNTDAPVREERRNVEHTTEDLLPDVQELVKRKLMNMQTVRRPQTH